MLRDRRTGRIHSASYVGYLANGLTRGEALSEAFNGQPMSRDEENWIGAQIVAESRQATHEQFANKITRRCVEWQLPNTPQWRGVLTTSQTVLLLALAGLVGVIMQSRALVLVAIFGIPLVLLLAVVTFGPGDRAMVKPGAKVFIPAKMENGALSATRVLVGKNGLMPPM